MNHVPYTFGHYSRLQPRKTNLRTSNESILQYIFCRQRCSCWPSFMVFCVVPGIKMSNATLEVLSQREIMSSPFKAWLKMMEQKKQSVYHHFLYYVWWLFRGSTTPLTVTYPLDSTVHVFSHVMIHVLPWSTGSVSFVLPLPRLRSECSMRQCLVRWIMVDDGRWCLDLVWNPGAECVS